MTDALSTEARKFINQFQGGFPIARRPFLQVAAKLGMKESALISMVDSLLADGFLSRFGPLFDAARMGGRHVLAAMAVPSERFGEVTDLVNRFPTVAHNYRRDHHLNMWFVVSAESMLLVEQTMDRIERRSGLSVYRFPKEREFYVGLFLKLHANGNVTTVSRPPLKVATGQELTTVDRELVIACQNGLPLSPEPYVEIAAQLSITVETVLKRLTALQHQGVIRRIGAVVPRIHV